MESRLFQTVHAFSNFNVDPTIDGSSVEVVPLDYFFKKKRQHHFHVFKQWQRGAEIIVIMSINIMAASLVERVLLISILNVVISAVKVAASPE
jgi:hypothetical protein